MNKIFILFALIITAVSFDSCYSCSCSRESQNSKQKTESNVVKPVNSANQNLNISIFLDLSDRISPKVHPNSTMEYFQRDIGYINSIAKAFETHMLHKKVILMNDKMQVFVDPLPSNQEINDIITQLRISFDKNNVTKEKIESISNNYTELTTKLYESAIKDNNFIGSDIWGFFKNKVKDYCTSIGYRNILVILTDGYAYHKDNVFNDKNRSSYLTTKKIAQLGLTNSNWEPIFNEKDCGFITKNSDLGNLEVLVLGINAYKTTPFEEDVIRKYWDKWLTEMGVTKYSIKTADIPTNLDGIIQEFILSN